MSYYHNLFTVTTSWRAYTADTVTIFVADTAVPVQPIG